MMLFLKLKKTSIPKPIYDTQIAAMFCGLGDQVSYNGLVNKFLGLTINKESQFSHFTILKDTIKNENQAHLAIYH